MRAVNKGRFFATAGLLVSMGLATGCGGNNAEMGVRTGLTALEGCDLPSAQRSFAQARASDPQNAAAALGFATTDLALMVESPEVTNILRGWGFSGPLRVSTLILSSNGLLARLARNDSCDSINTFLRENFPYAPVRDSEVRPESLIDPSTTFETFRPDLIALLPRIAAQAEAFEVAARGFSEPVVFANNSCGGTGSITLQRVEMLTAAAGLRAVEFAVQLALVYRWDLPLRLLFETNESDRATLVSRFNATIARVQDPSRLPAARTALEHALRLAVQAVDEGAGTTRTPPSGALFDWSQLSPTFYADIRRLAVAAQGSLSAPTPIPGISPVLSADLGLVFRTPINADTLTLPLFYEDSPGSGVRLRAESVDEGLRGYLSAPIVSPRPGEERAPEYRWDIFREIPSMTFENWVRPFTRLGDVYRCRSSSGP